MLWTAATPVAKEHVDSPVEALLSEHVFLLMPKSGHPAYDRKLFFLTGTMTSMSAADGLQAANRVMRRVTSEREYQPLASVDHHKLQALEADNRSAPLQPLITPHP